MKNIVGIDFGHGETSAGFVRSDEVQGNEIKMEDLCIYGQLKIIPSVVCITDQGEVVLSPNASDIAKSKEFGISFKDPLVGSADYSEITEENKNYFHLFLSTTYDSIIQNNDNPLYHHNNEDDYLVYMACPSGWNQTQIDAYKDFAKNKCKIPVVDIVKESRAAYIAARRKVVGGIRNQGGNVLVVDYGSSTIDFTYFDNDSRFEPVHAGYKLGARIIEETIYDYLVEHESGVKDLIANIQAKYGERKTKDSLLYEIRKQKERYFISPNQDCFTLTIDLRMALGDNSYKGQYIETGLNGYSKEKLLDLLADYRAKLASMLEDFLSKKGVNSIDKVILTGGASRMPFFKELLTEKYNVSRDAGSLISTLNPSLYISQGIAAFGYMNEQSKINEKPVWNDVNRFIEDSLPEILRNSLNTAVSDIYYSEFTTITNKYKAGDISDSSGRHNLDSLEDAVIAFLKEYTTSPTSVGSKIMKRVETDVCSAINDSLNKFCKSWYNNNIEVDNIDITFNFNSSFYLPVETAKGVLQFMWNSCMNYINSEHFFGTTSNTPYKDRDYSARSSLVNYLNSNLRTKCNALHFDGDLSEELSTIESAIRIKIQDIIDNAKLEMYR